MDVILRTSYGEAEISLHSTNDEATLADVVKHVTGQTSPPILFVDGRALPATTILEASGLLYGSTIATNEPDEPDEPDDDGAIELVQIAGRGAGTSAILSASHYVLGIGRRASARELDLATVDHPSFEMIVASDSGVNVRARTSSIRLDGGAVSVGDTVQWSTETLDSGDRVFQLNRKSLSRTNRRVRSRASAEHGTVAFTRPPRRTPLPEVDPITSSDREAISGHHGTERDRRRSAHLHVRDLVIMSRETDPRLWERRPGDADVFHVPVGLADVAWSPQLHTRRDDRDDARRIIEECGPLPMVPVSINLAAERATALVGPPAFTTDLARGLVLGAAVSHGPADLSIVVVTSSDRSHAWEWSKWLPHTRDGTGHRLLSTESGVRNWVLSVQNEPADMGPEKSPDNHLTFVIIDDVDLWRDRNSVLRPLFSDAPAAVHLLVLTDVATGAPRVCPVVITQEADLSTSIEFIPERRRVHDVRPFLASVDVATEVALELAPLDDPELSVPNSDVLQASIRLPDRPHLDKMSADEFLHRWSKINPRPSAFVGLSADGPVDIDMAEDGPQGVIAGVGASQLAQCIVAGLAANNPPMALNLVLFDLSDNNALGALADMPHTAWTDSEINEHRLERALRCLRAEVKRRTTTDAGSSFPRLVILVNVNRAATNDSDFLTDVAMIAHSGRDVGFHLLVAIEHPESLIDHKIVAASDFRIALRMTEAESLSVLGSPAASLFPTELPDRAYAQLLRRNKPILLQVAQLNRPLDIQPFVIGRELSPMEHRLLRMSESRTDTAADTESPSVFTAMAAAMNLAVARLAATEQTSATWRTICPDPLPDRLSLRSFLNNYPGDGVPFALVDLPDEQRQEAEWWQPELTNGLLIVGAMGSGKTALLKSLAVGVGERYSADDLHLYCFDASDSELDPLTRLPHTGAVAHPGDGDALLAQSLRRELDRRVALPAQNDASMPTETDPTIVVMVDGLTEFGDFASTAEQILRQGCSVRMHVVITMNSVDRPGAALNAANVSRVELNLNSTDTPLDQHLPAGRARRTDGSEIQLVAPPDDLVGAFDDLGAEEPSRKPHLGGRA